jgi:hypothetical protein
MSLNQRQRTRDCPVCIKFGVFLGSTIDGGILNHFSVSNQGRCVRTTEEKQEPI